MNDDDLISPLGTEDTITLSSSGLYDWDPTSANLTTCSITTPSLTLNPNAYPFVGGITNGGIVTGSNGVSGTISGVYGAVPPQQVNIWADSDRNPSGHIDLKGENADITINGRSLNKTIQALEERLNMLRFNEHLEAEWDQLRELGEAYRRLEADLIEKQRAWEILKKQ
jgi:hypothetical protein